MKILLLLALLLPTTLFAQCDDCGFIRGDVNCDGFIDQSDVSYWFIWQQGGPAPARLDAADANDDGVIDISDPIYILNLFQGGPEPPCPYPAPEKDSKACDALDPCESRPCGTLALVGDNYTQTPCGGQTWPAGPDKTHITHLGNDNAQLRISDGETCFSDSMCGLFDVRWDIVDQPGMTRKRLDSPTTPESCRIQSVVASMKMTVTFDIDTPCQCSGSGGPCCPENNGLLVDMWTAQVLVGIGPEAAGEPTVWIPMDFNYQVLDCQYYQSKLGMTNQCVFVADPVCTQVHVFDTGEKLLEIGGFLDQLGAPECQEWRAYEMRVDDILVIFAGSSDIAVENGVTILFEPAFSYFWAGCDGLAEQEAS
jgi:hypothetical protein